jgi:hypothetical protein
MVKRCRFGFASHAHPALRHALTVDMATTKARHTDYEDNHNPPILHLKETLFAGESHCDIRNLTVPTSAEEAAGLYGAI